jgi:hypothetical protein
MGTGPGKNTVVKIGTAGSETDITAYVDKTAPHLPFDKNDTSVYGPNKSSVAGQYEASYDFEGPWSPEAHAILQPLRGVSGKSFVFGPQGSTAGLYKATLVGWLEYEIVDSSTNNSTRYKCTFHQGGAFAESTF